MNNSTPSYMVYMGRNIPADSNYPKGYVSDYDLNKFLNEQPYFDSFTIWNAQGSWKGEIEDTCVIEVFDTDFDIIEKFAKDYKDTYYQEAVYIKISDTFTSIINGDSL